MIRRSSSSVERARHSAGLRAVRGEVNVTIPAAAPDPRPTAPGVAVNRGERRTERWVVGCLVAPVVALVGIAIAVACIQTGR